MKEEIRLLVEANLKIRERCVAERVANEQLEGKCRDFNNHVTGNILEQYIINIQ